jgi:YidC/Oxa1 family membrane protein insertase
MNDQKNMLLAIILSMAILFVWDFFYGPKINPEGQKNSIVENNNQNNLINDEPIRPNLLNSDNVKIIDRDQIIKSDNRVQIETESLRGSISLKGLRLDDLTLVKYRETTLPDSNKIILLSPKYTDNPYYTDIRWLSTDNSLLLPNIETEWSYDKNLDLLLNSSNTIKLYWHNGQDIHFKRTITIDDNYMFTIYDEVENKSNKEISLYPYGSITRIKTPKVTGFFILHEGPLGVFDDTLKEFDYSDLQEKKKEQIISTGGWSGITDKYWLTALAFEQNKKIQTSLNHIFKENNDHYQVDFVTTEPTIISPGQSSSAQTYFFAGAKEVKLLDQYSESIGISRFDLAIDFGWFYFLTKPLFYSLIWLKDTLGNFGLAILILTVFLRLLLYPLADKQFKAMTKLKKLQPDMKKLQERYADDKTKLNQELMELYKKEKANPAAGCLPILVQIPIFFALYKVLFVTIEMRHTPFYGWINDMSARDPTSIFNLFGLLPYDVPSLLVLGAWPIIMGITMWLQQKLNPAPTDPIQAKIMSFLPIIFTVMLASFPAGLVIYWAWSNALGILQQWSIMRKAGVKA